MVVRGDAAASLVGEPDEAGDAPVSPGSRTARDDALLPTTSGGRTMSHALASVTPDSTLDELRGQEGDAPVRLGYTPDQMPVVMWPRGGDPVLEVGCVQIRLFRLTEGLRAGLAECLQRGPHAKA
jgi:hypothetical protein